MPSASRASRSPRSRSSAKRSRRCRSRISSACLASARQVSSRRSESIPVATSSPYLLGRREQVALLCDAVEQLGPRCAEGGSPLLLQPKRERVEVDACLGESRERLIDVSAVVAKQATHVPVVRESE